MAEFFAGFQGLPLSESRTLVAAAGERIEAVRFQPSKATARERLPLFTWRRGAIAAAVILVAWFLWFIFTAKAVRLEITPGAETVAVDGGFALRLGEVHLLREGDYRVRATASGYFDLDQVIGVGAKRNQIISLTMTRLPGRVAFDIEPEGALVEIAGHDQLSATAPFEGLVPAGPQVALLSHPRYQDASVPFQVEGLDRRQTLTATLAPSWAEVTIPSRPPGAEIHIDGEASGFLTPGPAPILAGERQVSIKLPGYKAWTDILHVQAQQPMLLPAIALTRADGRVTVDSTPRGAGVTVDGVYQGATPLAIAIAPDRAHKIRAFKIGYAPRTATLTVGSDKQRAVSFSLTALQGKLAIRVRPETAELWIDGKPHGTATGTLTLTATPHEIELKKAGYASYRKTVTPQPGFTQELKVRLLTLAQARLEALKRVRTSSQGHELVLLSPGAIRMGASRREPGRRANEVLRNASLTRLFYLGRHEVTNSQFRGFASGHSSGEFQNADLDGDAQPVTGVSWTEAALYCNWLSAQDGLRPFYTEEFGKITGFDGGALGYRLPTEAEWAWAARSVANAAAPLRFPWGDKLPPPEKYGNYADASATHIVGRIIFGYNDNYVASAPVGAFAPNAKGIHDLGGNVAEWIHDYYEIPDGADTLNPLGPAQGEYHVIRGASWMHGTITDLRLSFRDYGIQGRQDVGFRIARFAE